MALKEIRQAIETRLATWAATKSIPVGWENVAEEFDASHIRFFLFPASTQDPSMGAIHQRYRGLARIQYFSDQVGTGAKDIEEIGEELVALFPRGTQLVNGSFNILLERTPSQSGIQMESNYCYVVVEFPYRCDTIHN